MNASDFLAAFVVEVDYQTGAGCTAWNLPLPSGFSVLVMMHDYPEQPRESTDLVDLELCDPDRDMHERRERVTWELAAAIVTDWIALVTKLAAAYAETVAETCSSCGHERNSPNGCWDTYHARQS